MNIKRDVNKKYCALQHFIREGSEYDPLMHPERPPCDALLWRITMDLKKTCPDKLIGAETAMSKIKNGSRVFIGSGCGEPQHLIRTMVEDLKHAGHHALPDAIR